MQSRCVTVFLPLTVGSYVSVLSVYAQSIVQAVVGKLRLTIEELCVPLLLRLDSGAAVVSQLTARQFLRACKVCFWTAVYDFLETFHSVSRWLGAESCR